MWPGAWASRSTRSCWPSPESWPGCASSGRVSSPEHFFLTGFAAGGTLPCGAAHPAPVSPTRQRGRGILPEEAMSPADLDHPDRASLSAYALGKLEEADSLTIHDHL